MMKRIPIGFDRFNEVIDGGYYYVDKTDAIRMMMETGSKVYLYTRPRRFGKSLMLSTIDCFFNMKYEGNTWFDGLKVSGCRECDVHKNAYPVIKMDFKELGTTYESFIGKLRGRISYMFMEFDGEFYDTLNESNMKEYRSIRDRNSSEDVLNSSLLFLSKILHDRYGRPVVILIDEYDDPIHKTYGTPDSQKVLDFMRSMLSAALKGNDSLRFGVVTGVMQIAKESIFSGLNNLRVNSIFAGRFEESFGFTDDEVRAMCGYYAESKGRDAAEAFAEAKEWYDGYMFGSREIYNPWSILNYVDLDFKPDTYWANTSGNAIINSLLDITTESVWKSIVKLSEGEETTLSLSETVTISDLSKPDSIFPVMVMSGYLKARRDGNVHRLSIPNKEVRKVFKEIIMGRVSGDVNKVAEFIEAMVSGDPATMKEKLGDILMDNIGGLAFDSERSYNMAITCILIDRDGTLSVASEKESGNGRPDIALKSNRAGTPNIIMELKKADPSSSGEKAMKLAEEAIRQIHDKAYYHGMKGDTILYGISFTGRIPHIAMERISL